MKDKLNNILNGYAIKAVCEEYCGLENFDNFYIKLNKGCKISHLENISRELQLHLQLDTPPIFVSDNKTGLLRMVSAKKTNEKLYLKDIIKKNTSIKGTVCQIGLDYLGKVVDIDLTNCPHMLVVGTTGSGKSVFLNVLIANILNMGYGAELILIDPKQVEFSYYNNLLRSNISRQGSDIRDAISCLEYLEEQMNERYEWLAENGYRSVKDLPKTRLYPSIFIIIDEIADLIGRDDRGTFVKKLCLLASKSRAAGIHIIIATQRASASIIDGRIKANFPTRVVFRVASAIESRIVIDFNGAENLASYGDGVLYGYNGENIRRFKSAYVEPKEAGSYSEVMKEQFKKYKVPLTERANLLLAKVLRENPVSFS